MRGPIQLLCVCINFYKYCKLVYYEKFIPREVVVTFVVSLRSPIKAYWFHLIRTDVLHSRDSARELLYSYISIELPQLHVPTVPIINCWIRFGNEVWTSHPPDCRWDWWECIDSSPTQSSVWSRAIPEASNLFRETYKQRLNFSHILFRFTV